MIYLLIGQPGSGKTTLGTNLYTLLQYEKRNWRRTVFHIDGDQMRELYNNKDYTEHGRHLNITNAQTLSEYLHSNECDVVISIVSPYRQLREDFKKKMGDNIVEIYLHTSDIRGREQFHVINYEVPENNFIDIDTSDCEIDESFSKLVNKLTEMGKL